MVGFLEGVELEEASGDARRYVRALGAELCLGSLEKQPLRDGGQVATFDHEPRLEPRARREDHPFEELAGDGIGLGQIGKAGGPKALHVDVRACLERRIHRVASKRVGLPECLPELSEAPSQGAQGIVGFGKEQLGELASTRRASAEEQVRQEGPRFVSAWPRAGLTVALDARHAEQPYPEPHAPSYLGRELRAELTG